MYQSDIHGDIEQDGFHLNTSWGNMWNIHVYTVDSRYNIIIFYNIQQFEINHIFNHIKFTRYNIFYHITDINLGTISSVITRVDCSSTGVVVIVVELQQEQLLLQSASIVDYEL